MHPYAAIAKDRDPLRDRNLHITCSVRTDVGSEHHLVFLIKEMLPDNNYWGGIFLKQQICKITNTEWKEIEVFLKVKANVDCFLRISDQDVSKAPSTLQIKNLILREVR
ncbi:hypothetical protein [Candidatus Magnetomonas plexicatena]|uniref:hypothetical protein n=1 Tax=Candidatus Magnetomonas plexicatena TaxID=2552947 RepID=UPI001C76C325|nr:hypothetical protein E2O03_006490 [Nitrospirales bacterium LBB_01]